MKLIASLRPVAVAAFCSVFLVAASAQTSANPPPAQSKADADWDTLRSAQANTEVANVSVNDTADPASRKAARDKQAAKFAMLADQAKDFYSKTPDHAHAHEARKFEVLALVQAAQAGDTAMEGRLETTAAIFRANMNIPAAIRVQGAGAVDFAREMRKAKGKAGRIDAAERVARGLIAEFPTQPQGYESLLTLAGIFDNAKAGTVARELLASAAPDAIKTGAQVVLDRLALIGQSLSAVLEEAGVGKGKWAKAGQASVVFSWATWSPGSVALGQMLAKRNIGKANVIAVNLDEDTVAAAKLEQSANLPGKSLYDERGLAGAVASRLKLTTAPQVYLVDSAGIIRDVRGGDDLEAKLTQYGL